MNVHEAPLFSKVSAPQSKGKADDEAKKWLSERVVRSQQGVFTERASLTPARAKALLEVNECNRTLKKHVLSGLMADIVAKNWQLNGETLIVSEDGFLNDGQHRCIAVEKTGRTVDVLIVFGVTRESRTTVDVGAARTVGDQIGMEGGTNAHLGGAIAKMLIQFERDGVISAQYDKRPTTAMQRNTYWEHEEEINGAIHIVPSRGSARIGSKSFVSFVALLLRRKDVNAAKVFIERLCDGNGLSKTDPIYWARERLSDPKNSKRLNIMERLEIVLRHWNAWRRGARMSKCSQLQNVLPEIV